VNTQPRYEIRLGLIALALSGLLWTLNIGLRGGPFDLADPGACCRAALSPSYMPTSTLGLFAVLLNLYGFLGLYRYLTYRAENRIALLAVVLTVAGLALFLPVTTFYVVNVPLIADLYQQGHQAVIAVVESNFVDLGLVVLGVSSVGGIGGAILFGVAIWRDGRLPKWTGVLFALSIAGGLAFPVSLATELLGAVLLMISAGVIARKGWQESVGIRRQVQWRVKWQSK
jgi:hypothetical protein